MFEEIIGREGMIRSANEYGTRIRKTVNANIFSLLKNLEYEIKILEHVKTTQERWYPHVGITVDELEEFKNYLEKMVTIFKVESSKT